MNSIKIKGKEYICVNERVKHFRESEEYKGWSLESEIIALDGMSCVIKAIIKNAEGRVIATGFAQEDRDNKLSLVNKTSFVENCETSAWGRALGNLGIGIDASIASAEEVVNAMAGQLDVQSVYTNAPEIKKVPLKENAEIEDLSLCCKECGQTISEKVAKYSKEKFGKELCFDCQQKVGK